MGYGFKHGAGGSTGKALGTLVVTAPVGVTATASKEDKTYTKVVNEDGTAVFKGLTTGEWTITIDNGSQTSTQYVMVTLDYALIMAFFASTISVTYPIGATCTCSDGITTFTAPDMGGSCVFTVPNAGEWTVTITDGINTVSNTVEITSDGQIENVKMAFFAATISVTYPAGSACTCSDGTTTLTAPDTSGSCVFTVRNIGSWTVSATDGNETASSVVAITSDGQAENVTLLYEMYLYNAGEQYVDITGGWTDSGWTYGAFEVVSATIGDNSMTVKGQTNKASVVGTKNMINMDNISKIYVDIDVTTGGSIYCGVTGTLNASECLAGVHTGASTTGASTIEVDVSSLTGEYYFVIFAIGSSTYGATPTATVTKVLAEP